MGMVAVVRLGVTQIAAMNLPNGYSGYSGYSVIRVIRVALRVIRIIITGSISRSNHTKRVSHSGYFNMVIKDC